MKLHITKKTTTPTLAWALVCTIGLYTSSFAQENKNILPAAPHSTACTFTSEENGGTTAPLATSFVEMGAIPGGLPVITDMVLFNNRLYLSQAKDPLGDWGAKIFYTTNGTSFTKVLDDNTSQGYLRMGVFDNKLWIPDGDPNGMDPGYVYISSTGDLSSFTKTPVISAVHTFDVVKYNNKHFCSNGMSSGQGGLCKYNGTSQWTSVYESGSAFRMKYMTEFNGKLIVANSNQNSDVDLFIWNGDVETTSPTLQNSVAGYSGTFRLYATTQGKVFWTVASSNQIRCMVSSDAVTWQPVTGLNGKFVSAYCELNGKMYALATDGLWESADYINFTNIAAPPASDPNAFMPLPVTGGGYNSDAMASMVAYNGSIWCGSSTSGKLYNVVIATSVSENTNQSLAFDRISPNPFTISTTIQMTTPLENATMTIYSSLGQVVKIVKNINGNSFTIERGELPGGLYYAQLSQNNTIIAADKLVIID